MEDLLYWKDLYAPVEDNTAKLEAIFVDNWKKLNCKTIGIIRQWVDDSVFHHVSNETSTSSLWEKLEDLYERTTADNKICLIKKLVNLKFKESRVAEHPNETQTSMS